MVVRCSKSTQQNQQATCARQKMCAPYLQICSSSPSNHTIIHITAVVLILITMKASINGPNRRKNRVGDKTVASHFDSYKKTGETDSDVVEEHTIISFKVRSLETYLELKDNSLMGSIGDACIFTVYKDFKEGSGYQLLNKHFTMSEYSFFIPRYSITLAFGVR